MTTRIPSNIIVAIDASEVGWGAVLQNRRRKKHPAAYIYLQIPTTPDPLMSLNPGRTLRSTPPGAGFTYQQVTYLSITKHCRVVSRLLVDHYSAGNCINIHTGRI